MKLYYHPLSTYSQKVLIALHEKGLEFEPEIVHLMEPDARKRYLDIYPMGKIPMLMTGDDHMIPESSIIIEYLDGLGGPRLIPEDAEQARKTRFKDRMFDNSKVKRILGYEFEYDNERGIAETAQWYLDHNLIS